MSELKEIGIRWEENGELHFSHVYRKSDVDSVIEEKDRAIEFAKALTLKDIEIIKEKDKEIAELKEQLESEKASRYADSVDAGMRERRLKRALWLARAERARTDSIYWLNLMYDEKWSSVKFTVRRKYGENVKPRQTTRTPEKWFNVWDVVELYCKHKSKEYK